MRFFPLFALIVFLFWPLPSAVADPLITEEGFSRKLLENEDPETPKTVQDFSNLYFERCVAGNREPSLASYVETQCACTAAEMTNFMTLENMQALFSLGREGNFQYARMLMLGYIPCLRQTIKDLTLDTCLEDRNNRARLRYHGPVCACFSESMGEYIKDSAQSFIPGFKSNGFDRSEAVSNPLAHIMGTRGLNARLTYHMSQCVNRHEFRHNIPDYQQ